MIDSGSNHPQTFHRFYNRWLGDLNSILEQLVSAANHHQDNNDDEDDSVLRSMISKVVGHYEEYFNNKSYGAKGDVISMFKHTWLTSLEDAFLWIAGWRPTTAIHLLYSKSGIQLEAKLDDLIPVLYNDDLGDLTANQINRIDELQKKTIRDENIIGKKMATLQESAADTPMVDLSNSLSEKIRNKENDDGGNESDKRVETVLEPKKDELEEVLYMADCLRMKTLKSVVEILTPIQAVYFLIAAAELHIRLHDWGQKRDAV